MAPQQPVTDLVVLLDNPPDVIPRREELFHLRNGTVRLTPEEFDRYWPYMTNAWHKHSTHAKPATPAKPIETRIFWCRNGRADGRASLSTGGSRGLRRRIVEQRPQCPVKMSITVHYAVHPDQSIGPPVLYELIKKSGGDHKESLRSIDSKRRNEKVIEACTQHLLENQSSPTHFIAKMWKDEDRFRLALEEAGGGEVGPDDAQNYVRQAHLSRMKKTNPKRDSVGKSTAASTTGGSKLLDPEVLAGIKSFQGALPAVAKARPQIGDVMARRQTLGLTFQYFTSILPPLPTPPPDPTTGFPAGLRERDFIAFSTQDGQYIPLRFIEPPVQPQSPQSLTSCILYLHPGALVASTSPAHLPTLRHIVTRTNVPALSVEYRLAPDYTPVNCHAVTGAPMPGAVQDAWDALSHLRQHSTELGIDASRIVVVGEGGGGAVAATLCHYALKRGGGIAKQVLCAPMLDDRPGGKDAPPQHLPNGMNGDLTNGVNVPPQKTSKLPQNLQLWTAADDTTAWQALLTPTTSLPSGTPLTPDLVPGRMNEAPRSLPPVYIDVGEHDILRDECVEYARKCWIGGVSCELHVFPGVGTWFESLAPRSAVGMRAWEGRVRAITSV